jgi:DNA polymerase-3 subunit delta'
MSWQGIVGHDDIIAQFRRRRRAGRITGTFLFVGPSGIGKRLFTLKLAQALLCRGGANPDLDPCGRCEDCRLCEGGTHPDLLLVGKPADKADLPLDLLLGPKERRHQEGLCHDIGLKPFRGGRRIAVIDDADFLNEEGANCLLKTLEEPPPKSVMILLGTSPDRQLPTIRSRSQLVRFRPLSLNDLATLIQQQGLAADEASARKLAATSRGSLDRAKRLADPEFAEFRRDLDGRLATGDVRGATLAATIAAFTDAAGKEAGARRERMRWAFGFLVEFFQQVTAVAVGGPTAEDGDLQQAAERAGGVLQSDAETLAAVVDRCLDGLEQIDRNANPSTLVDAVCDDVERILSGKLHSVPTPAL